MSFKTNLCCAIDNAWELVLDFKQPSFMANNRIDKADSNDYFTMILIPVLGLICALFLLLIYNFSYMIFSPIGASIVFAIAATLFIDLKESGRALAFFVAIFSAITLGNYKGVISSLHTIKSPKLENLNGGVASLVLVITEIFKVISLFILAEKGMAFWIIPVIVLAFTNQASLMLMNNVSSGKSFLAVEENKQVHLWIVPIIIMLFVALSTPKLILITLILVGAIVLGARKYFDEYYGGVSGEMITLVGSITEIIILLTGVLFL